MQVKCNDCRHLIEVDVQQKPAEDGLIEVGFECPDCHHWYHGYVTNADLEQKRSLLNKFKAKATHSESDFARYQRKREAFKVAFYRLNRGRPTGLTLPV